MNILIRRRVLWDHLRGALWVMPTVSVMFFLVAGAALSHVSISNDSPLRWLVFQGTPEDARQMLIVVSSTMITVTGLVFALTIIALQIASGQYSPRLLRNFMRDRGTQFVLSIFVGAFAYSMAGLHTVGVQNPEQAAFMPRLAVSGSLGLALASLGVLIYFIHHLSSSIQIDTIMSMIVDETLQVIDDLHPDQIGSPESEDRCPDPPPWAVTLTSDCSGYIQEIAPETLMQVAMQQDLVIRLVKMVGHHVVAGLRLPVSGTGRPITCRQSPGYKRQSTTQSRSGSNGPCCRMFPSASAAWSISATKLCLRQSTTPTPQPKPCTTCRWSSASWLADGWATVCTETNMVRCVSPFRFLGLATTCTLVLDKSAGSELKTRPLPGA